MGVLGGLAEERVRPFDEFAVVIVSMSTSVPVPIVDVPEVRVDPTS